MTNIREFCESIQLVLNKSDQEQIFDWNTALADAGYIGIELETGSGIEMQSALLNCFVMFGADHVAWTGSKIWFENQRDAVIFTLKWL